MPGRPFPAVPTNFAAQGTGSLNNIPQLDANFTDCKSDINDSAIGYNNYVADTGVANAYVLTLPAVPSAYVSGMTVSWLPLNTNTGPSTVNINSLGTVSLQNLSGQAVSPGDIVGGTAAQVITMVYTGANFQIISPIASNVRGSGVANFANAKVLFDDFMGYPIGASFSNNAYFGSLPWLASITGGGTVSYQAVNVTAAQTAFGELQINYGNSSSGQGLAVGGPLWTGLGAMEIDFRVNLGTVPGTSNLFQVELGLEDFTIDGHNAVSLFAFSSGGNPVWSGETISGNVISQTATIAAATGYNRYKIVVNPAWSSVSFFQGATQIGSALTTNIPSGQTLYPIMRIFSNGGTAGGSVYIDQFYLSYLYTN